jgi:hypothetical protein
MSIKFGAKGRVPRSSVLFNVREGVSQDGLHWCIEVGMEATPTQSFYIFCREKPSSLLFGKQGNSLYKLDF